MIVRLFVCPFLEKLVSMSLYVSVRKFSNDPLGKSHFLFQLGFKSKRVVHLCPILCKILVRLSDQIFFYFEVYHFYNIFEYLIHQFLIRRLYHTAANDLKINKIILWTILQYYIIHTKKRSTGCL